MPKRIPDHIKKKNTPITFDDYLRSSLESVIPLKFGIGIRRTGRRGKGDKGKKKLPSLSEILRWVSVVYLSMELMVDRKLDSEERWRQKQIIGKYIEIEAMRNQEFIKKAQRRIAWWEKRLQRS